MTIKMSKLVKILNDEFSPPFCREGLVKAEMGKRGEGGGINITIGPRNVHINSRGTVDGAGTVLAR